MRRTSVRDLDVWTCEPVPNENVIHSDGLGNSQDRFYCPEGPGGGGAWEGPVTDIFFTASVVIHETDVEGRGKGGVVIISIRLTY